MIVFHEVNFTFHEGTKNPWGHFTRAGNQKADFKRAPETDEGFSQGRGTKRPISRGQFLKKAVSRGRIKDAWQPWNYHVKFPICYSKGKVFVDLKCVTFLFHMSVYKLIHKVFLWEKGVGGLRDGKKSEKIVEGVSGEKFCEPLI